jgi:hypothetical protein
MASPVFTADIFCVVSADFNSLHAAAVNPLQVIHNRPVSEAKIS